MVDDRCGYVYRAPMALGVPVITMLSNTSSNESKLPIAFVDETFNIRKRVQEIFEDLE